MTSAQTAIRGSAFGSKPALIFAARALVAIFAIAVLLYALDLERLHATWRQLEISWFAGAVALWFANIWLQHRKWLCLLRAHDPKIPAATSLKSLFGAFPLGLITPGRWGEIGRALLLPLHDWRLVSLLAVVDKTTAFVATLGLGAIGLYVLDLHVALSRLFAPFARSVLVIFLAATLAIALFFPYLRAMVQSAPIFRVWRDAYAQIKTLCRTPRVMLQVIVYSCAFVLTFSAQLAFLFIAFARIDLGTGIAAALSTHFLRSVLPISLGDLGVREGMAVLVLRSLHLTPEIGVAAGLLLFCMNVALPAVLGLPILLRVRKGKTQ